jgi:hypothetical protein
MPNWVSNRATISGPAPVIAEITDILNDPEGNLLNWMVPQPRFENDSDWYDWNINNWGTKWPISDIYFEQPAEEDSITFEFCTAWSPCVEAFHTWAAGDGRVQFTLDYWEPGMAFVGTVSYDGEYLSDDHRDMQSDRAGYLDLAETLFGYVEDEEPEPLTEWYRDGVEAKGLKNGI